MLKKPTFVPVVSWEWWWGQIFALLVTNDFSDTAKSKTDTATLLTCLISMSGSTHFMPVIDTYDMLLSALVITSVSRHQFPQSHYSRLNSITMKNSFSSAAGMEILYKPQRWVLQLQLNTKLPKVNNDWLKTVLRVVVYEMLTALNFVSPESD